MGGDSASKLAVLLLNLIAARALAPPDFARYVGVLATGLLGAAFWDAGVSTLVSVEIAKRSAPTGGVLRRVLWLRMRTLPVWGGVLAIGYATVARAGPVDTGVLGAFAAASVLSSIQVPVLAGLRAKTAFAEATVASAAGRWVTVGLAAAVLVARGPGDALIILALATLLGELATSLLALVFLRRTSQDEQIRDWDPSRITLRASLPYASNGILNVAYNRLDVVLVAALTTTAQFAAFAPASRIQDALYLLPGSLSTVAVPTLARLVTASATPEQLTTLLRKLWLGGAAIAIPASIVLFALMPQVIAVLIGDAYVGSLTPTRILMWSMLVAAAGAPLVALLIALDRGADTTRAFATAFCVSLGLHLALDWWLGAIGAAIASLARDGAFVVVGAIYTRRALQRFGVETTKNAADRSDIDLLGNPDGEATPS